jgi:hypothetical protein
MGTIVWQNLSTIPACELEELRDEYDALGHLMEGHEATDVIYVYLQDGDVIEVRPATGVRVSSDCVTVLNGKTVVARYPRERVVQASREPIETAPFD